MEDAVTCPVCCEVYRTGPREPLVLPCGHTVCRSCLKAILASEHGRLACPICRENVGVFDHLPVCFPLLSLSSSYCVFKVGTEKCLGLRNDIRNHYHREV